MSEGVARAPKADGQKSYQGLSASLSLAEKAFKAGDPVEVTITLASATDTHRLFNPFFNGLLERPGRLVIRDAGGKEVNRLLDFRGGSRRTPSGDDYVRLPAKGSLGARVDVYPLRKALGGDDLPPGDYTMQLVLHGSLLGLGEEDDAKEIVRTERVAFRVSK